MKSNFYSYSYNFCDDPTVSLKSIVLHFLIKQMEQSITLSERKPHIPRCNYINISLFPVLCVYSPGFNMYSYSVLIQHNFEAVKTLFNIFNALGAFFYYLNTSKWKYFSTLYSIMVFLLYVLEILLSILIYLNSNISAPLAAFGVFKLCESTVPIFVIVQSVYSGRTYLKSCTDDIIFTDKLLHISGIGVGYEKIKRTVKLTFIITTVYIVFVLGTSFIFFIHFSKRPSILVTIGLCIVETSHVIYNVYFNYFFCMVLIMFKQRFKTLNEQIQCLTGSNVEDGTCFITVKPYYTNGSVLKKIKTVKFVHAIYRQSVIDHNNRFGFVVLLQFIQVGTVLILSVYFLLLSLITTDSSKDSVIISTYVVSVLRCCTFIMSMIVCCVVTSSEANQMENIVHEVMNETVDREVFQELEIFSLELIHAQVEFTAYGFYTIDYCLLTKLVGSVVSYLIIFLQLGDSNSNYGGIFDFNKDNQTTSNFD